MMRQSSAPRTRSLSSMAQIGTANAKARLRKITPANTALAATGVKLGACGNKRATTSSATRPAASGNSIARAQITRRTFAIEAIASFPLLRGEAPEHHVECLQFVYTETPVSIGRIDPQLPIFLGAAPALVGDIVDLRQKRRVAAAGRVEGDSMRARLGRIHRVEHGAALRPGKTGYGLDHSVAVIDDQANGGGLRERPVTRREQKQCQQRSRCAA